MSINGSSGTRSRKRRILDKAGVILQNQGDAVTPAAQAATWSGGPDGVASGCQGRLVAAGLSDARMRGKGSLATLGSCLKNPAVDLANVPANRERAPKVIPTLLAMPLAGTFAGHRSRYLRHILRFMSKPRIFVSSTYYDLKHVRSSLEAFIERLGYEPILSEKGHCVRSRCSPR